MTIDPFHHKIRGVFNRLYKTAVQMMIIKIILQLEHWKVLQTVASHVNNKHDFHVPSLSALEILACLIGGSRELCLSLELPVQKK